MFSRSIPRSQSTWTTPQWKLIFGPISRRSHSRSTSMPTWHNCSVERWTDWWELAKRNFFYYDLLPNYHFLNVTFPNLHVINLTTYIWLENKGNGFGLYFRLSIFPEELVFLFLLASSAAGVIAEDPQTKDPPPRYVRRFMGGFFGGIPGGFPPDPGSEKLPVYDGIV